MWPMSVDGLDYFRARSFSHKNIFIFKPKYYLIRQEAIIIIKAILKPISLIQQ